MVVFSILDTILGSCFLNKNFKNFGHFHSNHRYRICVKKTFFQKKFHRILNIWGWTENVFFSFFFRKKSFFSHRIPTFEGYQNFENAKNHFFFFFKFESNIGIFSMNFRKSQNRSNRSNPRMFLKKTPPFWSSKILLWGFQHTSFFDVWFRDCRVKECLHPRGPLAKSQRKMVL